MTATHAPSTPARSDPLRSIASSGQRVPTVVRPGLPLPPGRAACLARCGWIPPDGVSLAHAAHVHRAQTGHPTAFRPAEDTRRPPEVGGYADDPA